MITFWETGKNVVKISDFKPGCWVNVKVPTAEETDYLIKEFNIAEDFIKDVLDIDERPRIELDEPNSYIILRVPLSNPNNGVPYVTVPLGIALTPKGTITICSQRNEVISQLFKMAAVQKFPLGQGLDDILRLFFISASWYLQFLKEINAQTSHIEKDLEYATRNEELHKLLRMEKCLVYFITSIKGNEMVLEKIRTKKYQGLTGFDEDLMEDVTIENRQALEMAKVYSDIQSGMMDAFASIISNNLNVIMKQLTSVTIVLMIPTLIASLYGMNVSNHFENSPYAFYAIILISVVMTLGGILFFKRKSWF
ncbi:MAG: magnesium transporter [Bacteroidetes bacterium GWF2_42_66]|nr:MAG: magnesium transporter [Bacteroidetes bacterium GWA2_42_15]OFX97887.1 MAG: magnesium transporter [Bacteroidetes bacterium GWE2_42_39]OFY44136.1 MAG: magnesium transporter [Bacteroidetes bacterium GWF2_42_66]HAZ03409.1 magnesium transporter [Marinilabiliales bacterium]HBL74620.1 magnesium transporter [Prolixibacteraceae bacterium]